MGWLRLVGSLKVSVSSAKYRLSYGALWKKRFIMLRSLLIVATPHQEYAYSGAHGFMFILSHISQIITFRFIYSHVHVLIVIFPYSKAMFLRATPNALPRCTRVAACCSACDAACCNTLGILGMTPAVGWSIVCRAATSPQIHDSSSS